MNTNDAPRWANEVPTEAWQADLDSFPRTDEHIPDWLKMRLEGPVTE